MGKSFRKINIRGNTTSNSEKKDKQFANRKLRRKNKQISFLDLENPLPLNLEEVSDRWQFGKDGKSFFNDMKYLRK